MREFGRVIHLDGHAPMTIGQVLTRVRDLLRTHAVLYLKLALPPIAAMFVFDGLMFGGFYAAGIFPAPSGPPGVAQITRIACFTFSGMILMGFVFALYEAATCTATLAAHRGQDTSARDGYERAWTRVGTLIWLLILRCAVGMLPVLLVGTVVLAVAGLQVWIGNLNDHPAALFVLMPLMILAYLGAMAGCVWIGLRYGLAVPACLHEDLRAMTAMHRSAWLTRGAKGRMFVVLLVIYLCGMVAIIGFELLAGIFLSAGALVAMGLHTPKPMEVVGAGIMGVVFFTGVMLVNALQWAGFLAALAVMYDDQRPRFEGVTTMLSGEPA